MLRKYYLRFEITASVNYLYLFSLMEKAEYNIATQAFDTIHYVSISHLATMLSLSTGTADKLLNSKEYNIFFHVDKATKTIYLHNSVKG